MNIPLPASLRLRSVTRSFPAVQGEAYTAIRDIDLDVTLGEFVSVVGPSGCGKSTLLNLAAGLIEPSSGTVEVFGERLSGINRRAAYMFQQDALLPWKTVAANIALGLDFRRTEPERARDLVSRWVNRAGLNGFATSYPYQLSGGMRKRVAMAQCWIVDPDIVLMDEPFSALDVHTRLRMETEILDIWSSSRKTVLFVTHDLEEAISLADRVVVLSAGPGSTIVGIYPVPLPRPRNLIDIKTDPQFSDLYRSIWGDLKQEVLRSYERNPE